MFITNAPLSPAEFSARLAAARSGDPVGIEYLVERYYSQVQETVHNDLATDLRRSRPWLLSRFSTGDVVQEVFRSLLNDLERFEGKTESAFCGYLAMIIRNRLVDAVRFHEAEMRDGRISTEWPQLLTPDSVDPGPATSAAAADTVEKLRAVLGTLPEREQLLLRARAEQDTQFSVLAERLGYPSMWAARRAYYAAQSKVLILLGTDPQE